MGTIAIAGASGFVGVHLMEKLRGRSVIGLGRGEAPAMPQGFQWRKTDLFSAQSTFDALAGVDVAIYLVHSMMPSTSLFQGNFSDTDLLLADNFAHACKAQGVKQIIFLGGLMPEGYVSAHLKSRQEVEDVFRSTGIPVTLLRSGMVVGPGGSSFGILRTLVERLPLMILPRWTGRSAQAVFIDDVVDVLAQAIDNPAFQGQTLDLVNGEPLVYADLLRQMAQVLGTPRPMFPVPVDSTAFSKLWVTLFSSTRYELVSPLIDSLACDLPVPEIPPLLEPWIRYRDFAGMARETLRRERHQPVRKPVGRIRNRHSVRSIQRLPAVPGVDAEGIAQEYLRWLPAHFRSIIRVETEAASGLTRFFLTGLPAPLLVLKYVKSQFEEDRRKFHIVGGLLSRTTDTGWLEFRQVQGSPVTLTAIHEFVPALPWFVYLVSQAPLHRRVMVRFGRYLQKSRAAR